MNTVVMIGSSRSTETGITLLLTATINPRSTTFVRRSDPTIRLTDYRIALSYWLKEPAIERIVFCENSGAALDQLYTAATQERVYDQEIIFVSFTAPETDGARGKGYGELGILSHVLSCQILNDSDHILKVTGRYVIDNFHSILANVRCNWNADVITTISPVKEFIPSACFYASVAFLNKYVLGKRELVNDTDGFYFEHALAQARLEAARDGAICAEFTDLPYIKGICGTTNLPYTRDTSTGIEVALTPDYLTFLQAVLVEFCQWDENEVGKAAQSDAAGLIMKFAAYASAVSLPTMISVNVTHAELRVLRASIEFCLRESAGLVKRTGFTVEAATAFFRAIEHQLAR